MRGTYSEGYWAHTPHMRPNGYMERITPEPPPPNRIYTRHGLTWQTVDGSLPPSLGFPLPANAGVSVGHRQGSAFVP